MCISFKNIQECMTNHCLLSGKFNSSFKTFPVALIYTRCGKSHQNYYKPEGPKKVKKKTGQKNMRKNIWPSGKETIVCNVG